MSACSQAINVAFIHVGFAASFIWMKEHNIKCIFFLAPHFRVWELTFIYIFIFIFNLFANVLGFFFTGALTELYPSDLWPSGHIYMMSCLVIDSKQGALQVSKQIFSQSDQRETVLFYFFLSFFLNHKDYRSSKCKRPWSMNERAEIEPYCRRTSQSDKYRYNRVLPATCIIHRTLSSISYTPLRDSTPASHQPPSSPSLYCEGQTVVNLRTRRGINFHSVNRSCAWKNDTGLYLITETGAHIALSSPLMAKLINLHRDQEMNSLVVSAEFKHDYRLPPESCFWNCSSESDLRKVAVKSSLLLLPLFLTRTLTPLTVGFFEGVAAAMDDALPEALGVARESPGWRKIECFPQSVQSWRQLTHNSANHLLPYLI